MSFVFGLDCTANRHFLADELPPLSWQPLVRPPKYEVKTVPRAKPQRVKEKVVREREFKNIVLQSEDVAEMPYRPTACTKTYRLIVVRKNLSIEKGEAVLFPDYRYFFYLTNDPDSTPTEVVLEANEALQPREPQRPTARRRASPVRPGGHARKQLGLHGDDGPGLEPESLVGAMADRNAAPPREASRRKANRLGHGVQDVRGRLRADAVPDRPHGPAAHLPIAELELLATALLPHLRSVAVLRDCP